MINGYKTPCFNTFVPMSKCYVSVLVFVMLFFFACEENPSNVAKQISDTSNLDSAQKLLDEFPTEEVATAFYKRVKQYCQENPDTLATNKYIEAIFQIAEKKRSTHIQNLAEQCKTMQQFLAGNSAVSQFWAQQMLQSAMSDPSIDVLDNYHLAGIAYYSNADLVDSTLKYWKLGFQTAVEKNDEYRIYFFANNLGTLFYELDMAVISRSFFLKALSQAKLKNTVSPVLVNNILNTLEQTDDITGAIDFYEENKALFNVDPSKFQNQSVYLNSININQRLEKYDLSDSLIRSFRIDEIHPSLKPQYTSLHLRQYINTGDTFFIRNKIRQEAQLHGIGVLQNIGYAIKGTKDTKLDFLWKIIESDVNNRLMSLNNTNDRHLLTALDLLIDRYKNRNTKLHLKYQLAYGEVSRSVLNNEAEINHYIDEVKRVEDLFDKLMVRNKELDYQRSNMRQMVMLLFLLLVILIISVLYHRNKIKLKQNQEEILLKEKDILVRENAMNHRMVEFSKELIVFNKKIKTELDRINFSGDNTEFLKKFRSDLLGFVSVNLEQNPKAVDYTFEQGNKEKSLNEAKWERLNKTEKRAYTLFKEGFKANEIAGMLGVTTQYVYNLKARMKRNGIHVD
mgnify:CR=1 FL=1